MSGLLRRGSVQIARVTAIKSEYNQNGGGSGCFGFEPKARAGSR
jgi:hypothetical protein